MKNEQNAQTVLAILVGLLGVALVFKLENLFIVAFILGFLSLLFNRFSDFISIIWIKFAKYLGIINSYILLSVIFYFFLTPIAFLMRIVKKTDSMSLKSKNDTSVYAIRNHVYSADDLKNIW